MSHRNDSNSDRQLSTLIRLRERQRDEVALTLAAVLQSAAHLDHSMAELTEECRQSARHREDISTGHVAVQQLVLSQRYEESLIAKIEQLREQRVKIEEKKIELQQALVEAQQRLKSIETLRNNRAQEAVHQSNKELQASLDDWSITKRNSDAG
jgi:flagellar export protein FliJ